MRFKAVEERTPCLLVPLALLLRESPSISLTHTIIQRAANEDAQEEIHDEPREVCAPEKDEVGDEDEVGLGWGLYLFDRQMNVQVACRQEHL